MNRKIIFPIIIGSVIFIGLVFYNYLVAQRNIRETRPAPLGISLVSYPETVVVGGTGTFVWNVNSSPDLSTTQTTIYWGYIATPSALTMQDSPSAVGYSDHLEDYFHGVFALPDDFDLNIKFDQVGKVYFRAYAKVGDNYLWTDEKSLTVTPKQ